MPRPSLEYRPVRRQEGLTRVDERGVSDVNYSLLKLEYTR